MPSEKPRARSSATSRRPTCSRRGRPRRPARTRSRAARRARPGSAGRSAWGRDRVRRRNPPTPPGTPSTRPTGVPRISRLPSSATESPSSSPRSVVLPAPFGPTRPWTWPAGRRGQRRRARRRRRSTWSCPGTGPRASCPFFASRSSNEHDAREAGGCGDGGNLNPGQTSHFSLERTRTRITTRQWRRAPPRSPRRSRGTRRSESGHRHTGAGRRTSASTRPPHTHRRARRPLLANRHGRQGG